MIRIHTRVRWYVTRGTNTWSALSCAMDHPFRRLLRSDQATTRAIMKLTMWADGSKEGFHLWECGKVELFEIASGARMGDAGHIVISSLAGIVDGIS